MSKEMADNDSNVSADTPPAATEITFNLTATNESSLSGNQYFNIFPPALKTPSLKSQVLTALVSEPTSAASPTTTRTWKGGSGALALLAVTAGASPSEAETTPVALGDKVTVAWADGVFDMTPSPGGPPNAVEVTFAPGVPADSQVGLVVGPAPILVRVPVGLSPLTLEPDLSPTVTVVFGTAFQLPKPEVSDVNKAQLITFKDGATSGGATASAQIKVGLDNLIIETG